MELAEAKKFLDAGHPYTAAEGLIAEVERLQSNYDRLMKIVWEANTAIGKHMVETGTEHIELLCILGSIGDTQTDEESLENLQAFNEHGTHITEVICSVNDTPDDRRKRFKLVAAHSE